LFGNNRLANLVKAAGGNILNGVKYVPPLEQMHVLDPEEKMILSITGMRGLLWDVY
jgi:hypothetical protein